MFGLMPIAAGAMKRALELDPDWDDGAIHEILISLEPALPMPVLDAELSEAPPLPRRPPGVARKKNLTKTENFKKNSFKFWSFCITKRNLLYK